MPKSLNKTYENSKNGDKEATYVFDLQEDSMFTDLVPKITNGIWQILPSTCASLTCVPFGLMLGWPSPTYPQLLAPDSPVPITLNQSAMIAGCLMLSASISTSFSSKHIGLGPKYGIILGNSLIMLGWIIMWQTIDVYGLMGSRLVLGLGHGYAMGQIKDYISEMTEDTLSVLLVKQLNFYGFFGLVLAYAIGPFVEFRQYSLICLIISVFILFIAIFLPSTPRELIRAKKIQDAKKLLTFLKPDSDPEQEIYKIKNKLSEKPQTSGLTAIWRETYLRTNFIKLTILLICQQYCGAPSTLVYTQIIFTRSHAPYPEYLALVYAVLFFISNFIGTYVIPRYNKKTVLLISSFSVLILYICKILVIYYKINEEYFNYSSVIIMYLYIIIYTIGLGSIPFSLINDWFPKECRLFITKYFIILYNMLALTITKTFQVLMGQFELYIPFGLFSGIIAFTIIFTSICIPYDITSSKQTTYKVGSINKCESEQEKQ